MRAAASSRVPLVVAALLPPVVAKTAVAVLPCGAVPPVHVLSVVVERYRATYARQSAREAEAMSWNLAASDLKAVPVRLRTCSR
jgi:hypothetical protein